MLNENKTSESSLPVPQTADLPVLAAGLVHEVKNPLAAIHLHLQLLDGYATEIEDPELRSRIQTKVQIIKKEILSLNRTLHEFIRFVRPESKPIQADTDIDAIVSETVQLIEPQALREGIDVELNTGGLPHAYVTEPVLVKQILYNFILNSIEAFRDSEIPLEQRRIRVATGLRDSVPYISVRDNGPGIAPDLQEKIFDPFYSTKKEGTGLGLALVRKMSAEIGGTVEVHSTLGRGSEFILVLGQPRMLAS